MRPGIDRESAAEELDGLEGADGLLDDLEALVAAGLIEQRSSLSGTRFAPPADADAPAGETWPAHGG